MNQTLLQLYKLEAASALSTIYIFWLFHILYDAKQRQSHSWNKKGWEQIKEKIKGKFTRFQRNKFMQNHNLVSLKYYYLILNI